MKTQSAIASGRVHFARLVGLRLLLVLAVVLTGWLSWFYVRAERWDTPPLLPVLAVKELMLVAALFLLAIRENRARAAASSGCGSRHLGIG